MKQYIFNYGELNAFCRLCGEPFVFDFYVDKGNTGVIRKALADGGALTPEGEALKSRLCRSSNVVKIVQTAKEDFNCLYYIENGNEYCAVAPSAKCDVYAIKSEMTYEETALSFGATFINAPHAEYSVAPIELDYAERFLLILLCECEARIGRGKARFSDVFSEKTFSLLSYSKDFTVKGTEWQQYRSKFGKKSKWKDALTRLCDKGYVFTYGKINPRVHISEQIAACVSGAETAYEILYSHGLCVNFYKATYKAGLILISSSAAGVVYSQSDPPVLPR